MLKFSSALVLNKLTETHDYNTCNKLSLDLRSQITTVQDNYVASREELTAVEQSEVLASLNITQGWVKLMERVNFLALALRPSATTVVKKRFVKLPEIKLITFREEFDEWETFWSTIRKNVDLRDDFGRFSKALVSLSECQGRA